MEGGRESEKRKEKMSWGVKPHKGLTPLTTHEQKPMGVSRAAQPFISTLDTPIGFCYFPTALIYSVYTLSTGEYTKKLSCLAVKQNYGKRTFESGLK